MVEYFSHWICYQCSVLLTDILKIQTPQRPHLLKRQMENLAIWMVIAYRFWAKVTMFYDSFRLLVSINHPHSHYRKLSVFVLLNPLTASVALLPGFFPGHIEVRPTLCDSDHTFYINITFYIRHISTYTSRTTTTVNIRVYYLYPTFCSVCKFNPACSKGSTTRPWSTQMYCNHTCCMYIMLWHARFSAYFHNKVPLPHCVQDISPHELLKFIMYVCRGW